MLCQEALAFFFDLGFFAFDRLDLFGELRFSLFDLLLVGDDLVLFAIGLFLEFLLHFEKLLFCFEDFVFLQSFGLYFGLFDDEAGFCCVLPVIASRLCVLR